MPRMRPEEASAVDRSCAAIVFKGSGFYQTDYRSESYKKGAAAEKGAATAGKSETKSETKSEPKSGAKGKEKNAKD